MALLVTINGLPVLNPISLTTLMDWIGDPGAWMIYQVNLPIKCALYASPKTIVSEQISNSYVLNFDKFKVAVVVQVAQTE